MNGNDWTTDDRKRFLELLTAELTDAAYSVALRHSRSGSWLDLELGLWRALSETMHSAETGIAPALDRPESPHDDTILGGRWQMAHPQAVFRVGRATVTKVEDILLENFRPSQLIPNWLPTGTLDDTGEHVLLSVHTWVVREDDRIVLVDTGVGNSKDRPHAAYFDQLRTPYLERLEAIGIEPEAVDYVLLTHLHVDHVGWNTRFDQGRWVPTFPNARHIFSRAEHAYFKDPANHNERNRTSFLVQKDSVDPVVDAGLADMIAVSGTEPIPGFTFHSTPGHSIGHSSIELRSGGETALFAGDVLHHPVQVFHPEWLSILDAFPEEALRSRHWALDFAAQRDAMFFSSHFADSSAGKVSRHGKAYAWRFL